MRQGQRRHPLRRAGRKMRCGAFPAPTHRQKGNWLPPSMRVLPPRPRVPAVRVPWRHGRGQSRDPRRCCDRMLRSHRGTSSASPHSRRHRRPARRTTLSITEVRIGPSTCCVRFEQSRVELHIHDRLLLCKRPVPPLSSCGIAGKWSLYPNWRRRQDRREYVSARRVARGIQEEAEMEAQVISKVSWRIVPFIALCYFLCYLDRVNVGFAALQMNNDLGFTATMFGWGAGIFFFGYFLFEVPSNLALERFGARLWIARIMVT